MNQEDLIKVIDGVKTIRLYDGKWYCNFTDYKVKMIHDRGWYHIDQFKDWCLLHNLCPIL